MECNYCGSTMQEVDMNRYECHNPLCDNYLIGIEITEENGL